MPTDHADAGNGRDADAGNGPPVGGEDGPTPDGGGEPIADGDGPSILVAGDTLVDLVPSRPGPVGPDASFEPKFGGSAANAAVALERIGLPPLFWTRVARDDFGAFLADELAATSIPADLVTRDDGARTTLAVVTHDEGGEPTFGFRRERGADTRLEPGGVPDPVLERVSWVHTTGVTLSVEPSRTATLELMARASRLGCSVSLDPNARPEMWHSDEEFGAVVRGALEHVDVLKANPGDLAAAGIEADDPAALARAVTDRGPHTALLTLGGEGALARGTDASPVPGVARHPGYDVDVVDTTGAGDAFLAGALGALSAGVTDADRLLAVANAVGAVVTTRRGGTSALTGLDPVRALCGPLPWA